MKGFKFFIFATLSATLFLLNGIAVHSQQQDFYAYYTRLDFEDGNNTGKYADVVVHVNQPGKLVFSREYSYLP